MVELELIQIIVIGASTGFGSALGTELARSLTSFLRTRRQKNEKRATNGEPQS